MSFWSAFKSAYNAEDIKPRKNRFEGTVSTAPPKKTSQDRQIEKQRKEYQKRMADDSDIFEVLNDDLETEDMERLIKYNNAAYSTKQKYFRKAVLEKFETEDGFFICAHCGKKFTADQVHADHILPKSSGGSFSIVNGQILCATCNDSKNDDDSESDKDFQKIQADDKARANEDEEIMKMIRDMIKNGDF